MKFNNVVRSEAELRELMGAPVAPPEVEKTLASLDRHCLAFIERAPFVFVSSTDAEGRMDISPKGDAPGFVKVLIVLRWSSRIVRAISASTLFGICLNRRRSG